MTRGLTLLRRLGFTGCANKSIFFASKMSKRPIRTSPERKVETTRDTMSSAMRADSAVNSNLTINPLSVDTILEKRRQIREADDVEHLETPVKSENDKKEYRVIKLRNGLKALLISDVHSGSAEDGTDQASTGTSSASESDSNESDDDNSESGDSNKSENSEADSSGSSDTDDSSTSANRNEKMAACGLCVGVGSFSDPFEFPGMAHFLEHMVFMGSTKYPQENEFDAFVTKHGGDNNASTDCEHTTFYFDVQEKYLFAALDRFAQFFIEPLMVKPAIKREREAVDSEFQMAVPSDHHRKDQLFCSFAHNNHPASKFAWGNFATLRDNVDEDHLYEELHKFRQRHYSAHRMTLAIQARLPLDTLQNYVLTCFENVPNNELPPDDFTEFMGASSFDTPNFKKMYKIKPTKDICQIQVTWALPSVHNLYRSKPHHYMSWVIAHEGCGSLISYLRKKMWCLHIYTGNGDSGFEDSSLYTLFSLSLVLTDEGREHMEEILDAIFSFINLMKIEGPQKRIFDEIRQIEQNNFRFAEEDPAIKYVEDMCECMHFYPPRDYISGSDLYFEYDPDAIRNLMNYLTPENTNIVIMDKKVKSEELDKIEPWFKTKYAEAEIPQEWINRWSTIKPLSDFYLPLLNVYIVSDFSLVPISSDIPKYPEKVYSDTISEIWYRPDAKFRLPECFINIHLISPLMLATPQTSALVDMYIVTLRQLLAEELYPARAANFGYQVAASDKGIVIKVDGYSEKLPVLLTTIVKYMKNYENLVTNDLFQVMKDQQIKDYYNTFLKPSKLAKEARLSVLLKVHWTSVDKHDALRDISFNKFHGFVSSFTDELYVECLVQGNMTASVAIENVQRCINMLNCKPLIDQSTPTRSVSQIPSGMHRCKLKNFNKVDVNSVVTNYYQFGITSTELSTMMDLLMMIMEEPLFNQLRTQEQLGYDIFCTSRYTYGILGFSVTVHTQADKFTTEHIDERIEAFIMSFITNLKNLTNEELDSMKEALKKMKQCDDIHLKEEMSRNWSEITTREYTFDRIEKEILAIKDIKLDELIKYFTRYTMNEGEIRKLSIHTEGHLPKETEKHNNELGDLEEILDDAVKDMGKAKYSFEYITNDPQHEQYNYIKNIQEYKKDFYYYPENCHLS